MRHDREDQTMIRPGWSRNVGHMVGLLIVTAVAVAVAAVFSAGDWFGDPDAGAETPAGPAPKTPVAVMPVARESLEITDSYSGIIRPMERFSLGFEIGGRLAAFGANAAGKPLDEGDRVEAGQVLARLDDRSHRFALDEAKARAKEAAAGLRDAKAKLEQAQSDYRRADQLRRASGAISEAEYQTAVTQLAAAQAQVERSEAQLGVAQAQVQSCQKRVEDATLLAPQSGVISRRLANAGESINPNQPIFEMIQVDRVLLTAGVPEAYVGAIRVGQPVHVELLARDRFGQERSEADGSIYRVAEAADDTNGQFDVEVVLDNPDDAFRPGMIAMAQIVVRRMEGFRVPITCVLFREEGAYLFAVDRRDRARRLVLDSWIEQGPDVIVPELPPDCRTVVVRGQHRLVDGREVERVARDAALPGEPEGQIPVRTPIVGARPAR
jgi:RND family efflux transporter MFP subunit